MKDQDYNPKSILARFYNWLWITDTRKFKSLCPYAWRYIATILFLPILLLGKLVFYLTPGKEKISTFFDKVIESPKTQFVIEPLITRAKKIENWSKWYIVEIIIKWVFIICGGLVVLLFLILSIVFLIKKPIIFLAAIGGVSLGVSFILIILYLFLDKDINLGKRIAVPFKFIGLIISSTYHKMCPRINWVEKTENK